MSISAKALSTTELDLILDTIQAGVVVFSSNSRVVYSNRAAGDLLGVPKESMLGMRAGDSYWAICNEEGDPIDVENYPVSRVLRDGEPIRGFICGMDLPDLNRRIWLHLNATPIFEGDRVDRVTVSFLGITEQVEALNRLQRSRESMELIFERTPMGMCVTDEHGNFESVNPAYLDIYGYAEAEMLGNHFTMVVPEENRQTLSDLHDRFIAGGEELRGSWDVMDKRGTAKAVLADAALVTGQDGRPKKVTFVMDITLEKEYERKLEELATRDPLTGLFNRRYFFEQLYREISRSKRYDDPVSLVMFDIDHFKKINDDHGHTVGDRVLQFLSDLMQESFRELDVLCRYGGEEFVVLMPNTDYDNARAAAERFRALIESSEFPEGPPVTISGGVGQYGYGTADDFISAVDALLYQSKENGRNRITG